MSANRCTLIYTPHSILTYTNNKYTPTSNRVFYKKQDFPPTKQKKEEKALSETPQKKKNLVNTIKRLIKLIWRFFALVLCHFFFFFHFSRKFFTLELADGFSLEFEWQQFSASLQDSSQYSVLS